MDRQLSFTDRRTSKRGAERHELRCLPSGRIFVVSGSLGIDGTVLQVLQDSSCGIWRAYSATGAVADLTRVRPDVIVTDCDVSDLPGPALCRRLKDVSKASIIVVGAGRADTDCVDAIMAGADDYVPYPIRPEELRARIYAVLRRVCSREQPGAVEAGHVRVDLRTRAVTVAGRSVHLRPKEFDLLVYLLREPAAVHTTRSLLSAIWGAAVQRRPHYVRMCVAHLRQMVEPNPRSPQYIVTERGVGYRLQPTGDQQVA